MFSSIVQFVEEKDDDRIIGTGDSPFNKSMPKQDNKLDIHGNIVVESVLVLP